MKMLLAVERAKFTFPAQHRGWRQLQVVPAGNRVFLTNQLALVQKATRPPLPHPFSHVVLLKSLELLNNHRSF